MIAAPPTNPFLDAVAASGLIEAFGENIALRADVIGIIEEVFVQAGDTVEEGQELFQIDSRQVLAKIETAIATIITAQARLDKNQSQLDRLYAVEDPRALSLEDVRNKEYDVKIAQEELNVRLEELQELYTELDQHVVKAPKKGVVLRNEIRKGEFFGFDPDRPGEEFLFGQIDRLQVRIDVDETNAFRIQENQPAVGYTRGAVKYPIPLTFIRIEPLAIPKRSLTGVSNERIDTRVVQVVYEIQERPPFPIYTGQQIDVFIDAPIKDKASMVYVRYEK